VVESAVNETFSKKSDDHTCDIERRGEGPSHSRYELGQSFSSNLVGPRMLGKKIHRQKKPIDPIEGVDHSTPIGPEAPIAMGNSQPPSKMDRMNTERRYSHKKGNRRNMSAEPQPSTNQGVRETNGGRRDREDTIEDTSCNFSGGSVLCCDSITDSDISRCNKKVWKAHELSVAGKVWYFAKNLGVTGSSEEGNYIEKIRESENGCHVMKEKKVTTSVDQ
jgi:hypothetical protein